MSIDYFSDLEFVCHGQMSYFNGVVERNDFDYWGLQFSRRGSLFLQIDRNHAETTGNAAVFLTFPGASFRYGAADLSNGIEDKLYICFKGARVERYLQGELLQERRSGALIQLGEPESFMRKMRTIRALLMLPFSPENHARAVLELEHLLVIMKYSHRADSQRSDWRFEEFSALTEKIVASPELAWDFEKEARKLSVSYPHFRRLFEKFFQVPPGKYLLSARIEKAAALLSGTNLSIREIAHECGFEDEFYFSRIFKKYRIVSPLQYRENFR